MASKTTKIFLGAVAAAALAGAFVLWLWPSNDTEAPPPGTSRPAAPSGVDAEVARVMADAVSSGAPFVFLDASGAGICVRALASIDHKTVDAVCTSDSEAFSKAAANADLAFVLTSVLDDTHADIAAAQRDLRRAFRTVSTRILADTHLLARYERRPTSPESVPPDDLP